MCRMRELFCSSLPTIREERDDEERAAQDPNEPDIPACAVSKLVASATTTNKSSSFDADQPKRGRPKRACASEICCKSRTTKTKKNKK